ncbi:hypothetical protein C8R44DRAFT_890006 [Mycena epipterygia]|nr:hypothetical protein C8R44DRAFT_890006 [Mycena epipterygia]
MAASFKIPASYDQNRPKFDGETASSLKVFLRDCEAVCANGGITDEEKMKERLLDYLDHMDIREQWERLPSFENGKSFANWKKEILRLYPEIEDMDLGSLGRLSEICRRNQVITRAELGKLRRFTSAFTTEAQKLLTGSAQVTNKQLVEWILDVLDEQFASEVEQAMNQHAILAIAAAQPAGAALNARRGDKLPYKRVIEIADYIADNWSGRTAMTTLTGSDRYAQVASTIPTILTRKNDASGSKIKTEITERLDHFAGEMAEVKDLARNQSQRFDETVKRLESAFENSVRIMNQNLRGPAPHQLISQPGHAVRNEETQGRNEVSKSRTGDGLCYFCNGPHMIRDCHNKEEFINLGWVIIENGLIKLGNGGWIPKFPEGVSRMIKVEDHYRKQGITRESAKAQRASMMQSFHQGGITSVGGYYAPDMERIDHIYDTREDEMRSANIQSMLGQQPITQQSYLVPSAPVPQVIQPQMFSGVQQVAPAIPSSGIEISQLIQLFNAARGDGSMNGLNIQDQMVATRTGAKSDPPSNPGF